MVGTKLIAVIGDTGTGKSTFINCAVGTQLLAVGHSLESATTQIEQAQMRIRETDVILIDSPGILEPGVNVYQMITQFLQKKHPGKQINDFLLMYDIAQNRVNLDKIQQIVHMLCGPGGFRNMIVVVTMWDTLVPETGQSRLNELCRSFRGYNDTQFIVHDGTHQSAVKIISALLGHRISTSYDESSQPFTGQAHAVIPEHTTSLRLPMHSEPGGLVLHGNVGPDVPDVDVMDAERTQIAQQQISGTDNQELVHVLTAIIVGLKNVNGGAQVLDALSKPNLNTLQAALTSRHGIQTLHELAEAGHQSEVLNILDDLLCNIDITKQPQLYTTVFHSLYNMCVIYGDVPNSLFLDPNSIQLQNNQNRPQQMGGFVDIYLGQWMDQAVCIKALRRTTSNDSVELMIKSIAKEATIWRRLVHPNVTPFYGLDRDRFDMAMVCKWMPNGNIVQFLRACPDANRPKLVLDITHGLEYLHSEDVGIVHGDLKGANILVDEHNRACLTDFGLSEVMCTCHTFNIPTEFQSSCRWTAPEIFDPERFGLTSAAPSREADVYALAMVMWEIFTEQLPFPHERMDARIMWHVVEGTRPLRPAPATLRGFGLTSRVWSIMEKCWAPQPSTRLSASEVVHSLTVEWSRSTFLTWS